MAKRERQPAGYYRQLNSLSTADLELEGRETKVKRLKIPGELPEGCFEVERVVWARKRKGSAEYLVLWKGYPKEDSSWVRPEDITDAAIRTYYNPEPPERVILDNVSTLCAAVDKSLKSGVIRNWMFSVPFRTDVFELLFGGKGEQAVSGLGRVYGLEDFPSTYFRPEWYKVYDKLGDGCAVSFPVQLRSYIRWSPQYYCKTEKGILDCKPKSFDEVLTVRLDKIRC